MQGSSDARVQPDFHRTMADSVAELLRSAIVRGEFAPGERMPMALLSDRFGVSTMPIRSALQLLEREGIVVIHPHRGASVVSLTPDEIDDIYEIRTLIEPLAIRAAIPRMTGSDLALLDDLISRMNTSTDPAALVDLNNRFHMALYRPSGRLHVLEVIHHLRVRVQHYIPFYDLAEIEEARRDHDDLAESCRQGDIAEAERITVEHLRVAAKKISAAAALDRAGGMSDTARPEAAKKISAAAALDAVQAASRPDAP